MTCHSENHCRNILTSNQFLYLKKKFFHKINLSVTAPSPPKQCENTGWGRGILLALFSNNSPDVRRNVTIGILADMSKIPSN